MKIYEIGTGYTPIPAQVAAATESIVEELTKSFLNMNQQVEIIDISSKNRAETDLPINEVKIPALFTKSDVSLGIAHKLKRVVYSCFLALKLKKILKSSNEKVVLHFHNQYNLFFFVKMVPKKIREKAVIAYTNHNGVWNMPWSDAENILKKRYFQEIDAMKKADLIFVLNNKTKENIVEHLNIEQNKVIKISNGVNTDVYTPLDKEKIEELKQKYGLAGKRVILQVGSVNENKGQARSVNLLKPLLEQHDDLVFAFVGEVVSLQYFDQIETLIKEANLADKVRYLGTFSPGIEMNELYNIADATIFVSNYEGFPLVCIESLSSGTPVVLCSKVPLDFGEASFVCSTDDLTQSISQNILVKDACSINSNKARANALDNYSWEKVAESYLSEINI